MERLTTREEHPHGAEGVSKDKLTGRYCRGVFEATACVENWRSMKTTRRMGFWCGCRVRWGDTVYILAGRYGNFYEKDICDGFYMGADGILQIKVQNYKGNHGTYRILGRTIFLTEEAAQERLKEILNENRSG